MQGDKKARSGATASLTACPKGPYIRRRAQRSRHRRVPSLLGGNDNYPCSLLSMHAALRHGYAWVIPSRAWRNLGLGRHIAPGIALERAKAENVILRALLAETPL